MNLTVEQLRVSYRDCVAVDGVNLEIATGQVVVIVGPNGCGKSTLLRSIARLHRPDSGRILVNEHDVWKLQPRKAATYIALLPQAPLAPEAITVGGLVQYGRHPHQSLFRQWSHADEQMVTAAMVATGVADLTERRLDQLSGGQRQRCWLAMSLAQAAPLMLLDEPTSMLDLGHQVDILNLVRSLATAGRTIVMVLHDLISAARYADILVAMRAGKIVAAGPPQHIVNPDLVRTLYGVDADILTAPSDGTPIVIASANGHTPYSHNTVKHKV